MSDELEVLIEKRYGLGLITLNRPKAINALNHSMVKAMAKALEEWKSDDDVKAVVLTGAGERGLCAGGDIVSIYHDAKDGKTGSLDFWRDRELPEAVRRDHGRDRHGWWSRSVRTRRHSHRDRAFDDRNARDRNRFHP